MKHRKTLYLIDGSSYIFRAYYAIRQNLSNSKGFPTNALYGFANMLQKVVRDNKPDYLAVILDTGAKTFRHKLYPKYKANRSEPPEDLKLQFPYFEPLIKAYNIVCLKKEGFEADDIIGTLTKQGEANGLNVVIVSSDKDLMQLVGKGVMMLDTMKNKLISENEVKEKFGVLPPQVIEVMALMGDSSDNIPGVLGVGPKTAKDLIQKYGSLKNLYNNLNYIDKKNLKEKLHKYKDNAFLSHKLVSLDTAVNLDFKVPDLIFKEKKQEELNKLFKEFDFSSLMEELPSHSYVDEKKSKTFKVILKWDAFEELLNRLKSTDNFALDLETTNLQPMQADIVGISFALKNNEAFYIPLGHKYFGAPKQLDLKSILESLRLLLESEEVRKSGHNIKYDLIVLRRAGINLKGIAFDSMVASYILNPSKPNHNMDDLAIEYLGYKTITYKEVAGSGVQQIGFDKVKIEKASEYAAEDSEVTWRFAQKMRPLLDENDLDLFERIELPLIEVLAEIEMNGVLVDRDQLNRLSKKIDISLLKCQNEIYEIAGEKFAINSPKQLSNILFQKIKLQPIKKTKTGYSTDISVLEELALVHDLPNKIIDFRQLSKLKSTYVDTLPENIHPMTGRIHTSFNQTVAATGRLSSSNPNLQNIPIRTDEGREIRKAFIGEGKNQLLSADYSQIELRILAHLSEDPALIRAFHKGEDIHSLTAAEIFGQSLQQIDPSARRMAKAVNFGIVYGLSPFGLSRQLKITPKEAKSFIDQYFGLYKRVKVFMEKTIKTARERGYTSTILNRKRYLPDLNSKNKQIRSSAERIAINSPVQGSAADLIKIAMIKLHKLIKSKNLNSKMILQVHDELLFECPPNEKRKMEDLVKKEMEKVKSLKVPLIVDIGWGKNWNEAH